MMPERDWTDRPLTCGETILASGLTITRAPVEDACLVSGDLIAALEVLAPTAALVGLLDLRQASDGIQIARDRALLIGVAGTAGWQNGFACSPATGLYSRFDLSGPALADALSEGTSADLSSGSPSAAVLFAGLTCLLTRRGDAAELWVETAFTTYMTSWLVGRS